VRIGFLAMSGIRAADAELLEMGLTLPGFVERSKQIASLPSLGLLYLAACTPDGHDLRYAEATKDGEEPDWLYGCDLVAISTFSAQVFEAYAIADRMRARGVRVAMGGLHVSSLPDEAAEHADYVVVGEGENVWPTVVAAATDAMETVSMETVSMESGSTESGSTESGRVFHSEDFAPVDVCSLPVPRFDLLRGRPYNRYTVQTVRGCPWRCEFCASTVMLQRPYRKRPVDHVARDIRAILAVDPGAFIEFADDNTFVDKAWGKRLCAAIEPLGVKWFTETDISVADDPELLTAMARAGCRQVLVGLETPDGRGLRGVEQRANFKARRAADYEDAVRRIQDAGITVNGCFVIGLDGQGPSIADEIVDFVERSGLYEVQVTVQTAFPGTPLHARLQGEGRILEEGRWDLCTLFDINYEPASIAPDELRATLHELTRRLYSHDAVGRRRSGFFGQLRRRRPRAVHADRTLNVGAER